MTGWLAKVFSTGAKDFVQATGNVLDNLITNKEELAKVKIEMEKEVNRHMEALKATALKEIELENADRGNARSREVELAKTLGRADYFQYFIGAVAVLVTSVIIFFLLFKPIPEKNEHVIMLFIGELLGIVSGIYAYHYGSSMGSRLKDMRKP